MSRRHLVGRRYSVIFVSLTYEINSKNASRSGESTRTLLTPIGGFRHNCPAALFRRTRTLCIQMLLDCMSCALIGVKSVLVLSLDL